MQTETVIDALSAATEYLLTRRSPRKGPVQARRCSVAAMALSLPGALSAAEPGSWDIDSAVLFYSETDRVQAIEPVISATRWFDTDRALNTKLVVDTLTGASPNGAVPSNQPQTYTQASGNGSYTVAPNTIPLDDTFRDTRVALSGGWQQPLTQRLDGNLGLAASNEYDYLSLSINGGLSYALAQNNASSPWHSPMQPTRWNPKAAFRSAEPVCSVPARMLAAPRRALSRHDAARMPRRTRPICFWATPRCSASEPSPSSTSP